MPSVAGIAYFKASEAYKSGSVSLDKALSLVAKANGLKKSYIGYETEDDSVVFAVNDIDKAFVLTVDWVSKDDADALPNLAEIAEASGPAYGAPPTTNYVKFENTEGPFGAPITEFVTFTLKEGKTMAQLEPLVEELHQKLVGTSRFHGDSWAPVIGKDNVYHGILGWDTVDAHWDAVRDGPLKEVIDRVKLIADLWLVHAALKPFSA